MFYEELSCVRILWRNIISINLFSQYLCIILYASDKDFRERKMNINRAPQIETHKVSILPIYLIFELDNFYLSQLNIYEMY